jgi:alkylation response protein AidB-like acyl-CoA dehydrogenase
MRRPWWGPTPDDDLRGVLDLVDDLLETRVLRVGDDRADDVDAARRTLAEHGLWTLGAAEAGGGGGADVGTTLAVLARLGGTWPALAWASVQAHSAAALLAEGHDTDLLTAIHQGAAVAVVSAGAADLEVSRARASGLLHRVDAAGVAPRVLVLVDPETAIVLPEETVEHGRPLRRTGLDGALTHACAVRADLPADAVIQGPVVSRARTLLLVGAAAVAAGVAEAAAHAALTYSAERVQFGAPLTQLPTVQASLGAQVDGARRLLRTALGADLGDPVAAAAALAPILEDALDVAAAALQSHGGYGYMAEYAAEGLLRDLVSLRAASGSLDERRWAAAALVGVGP